jgi:uncharacterized protein (DUF1697 family)
MASKAAGAKTYVALLRGINVGGKNMLPMADLTGMFTRAGCTDVRNYIQSGNIVFKAGSDLAKKIPDVIGKEVLRRFGFQPPLVLRSAAEMRTVSGANPFLKSGTDPELLYVMFLANKPGEKEAAALDPARSPPDAFELRGSHIYLSLPNGAARSKLTNAYFDSKLKTMSTGRNWATVLKLVEMTSV